MPILRFTANLFTLGYLVLLASLVAVGPFPASQRSNDAGESAARILESTIPKRGPLPVDPPLEAYARLLSLKGNPESWIFAFSAPVKAGIGQPDPPPIGLEEDALLPGMSPFRARIQIYPVDSKSLKEGLAEVPGVTWRTVGPLTHEIVIPVSTRMESGSQQGSTIRIGAKKAKNRQTDKKVTATQPKPKFLELVESRQIQQDLLYETHIFRSARGRTSTVYLLRVVPRPGGLHLVLGRGERMLRSRRKVSTLARRHHALGALNASFFESGGRPLGLIVEDGRIVATPIYSRTSFGVYGHDRFIYGNPQFSGRVRSARSYVEVQGVNELHENDGVYVLTKDFGKSTGTETPGVEIAVLEDRILKIGTQNLAIPDGGFVVVSRLPQQDLLSSLSVGERLAFDYGLTPPWDRCELAVGGGPRLVKDGRVAVNAKLEKFDSSFSATLAPRSAMGTTPAKEVLLVAVDGRQAPRDCGVTLKEMASIMIELGADQSMNLDGGGSTALWVRDSIVNRPSDKEERAVSSAIMILDDE